LRVSPLESGQNRLAILRKLKDHLTSQRNKFYDYLTLLELEEADIAEGDFVTLKIHTEMEKEVLEGISAFQKVIDPLEELYRNCPSSTGSFPGEQELPDLRDGIARLKTRVQERNSRNRKLLSDRMEELKREILSIRRPFQQNSQFVSPSPSLIDITT